MPNLQMAGHRHDADEHRNNQHRRFGEEHQRTPRHAIGDRAPDQAQRNRRHRPEQPVQTELKRRLCHIVDDPTYRGELNPIPQLRGELSNEVEDVIALTQSEQPWRQPDAEGIDPHPAPLDRIIWESPAKLVISRAETELSIFLRCKAFYIVTRRLLAKSSLRQ